MRPFPSAPLRTGRDTFASSGSPVTLSAGSFLLSLACPRRSPGVDRDMASLADDERLALQARHDHQPSRFLPPPFDLQVRELPDVVDLDLISRPTEFARIGSESIQQLPARYPAVLVEDLVQDLREGFP